MGNVKIHRENTEGLLIKTEPIPLRYMRLEEITWEDEVKIKEAINILLDALTTK